MKLAIVIPAYNEENTLGDVLLSLPKKIDGIDEILSIVVDDGSTDKTYEIAKNHSDYALRHIVNLGVGAATRTSLEAAKKLNCNIVVTIDADGQHDPKDIPRLIEPILYDQTDIVIGTRAFKSQQMPRIRIFGNLIMNLATFLFFRKWVSDSQSGMKAFSKSALNEINLTSSGYEFCSEIIGEAKSNNLAVEEVKIDTIYTRYSKKKGQGIFNSINIVTRLALLVISPRK